MLQLFVVFIVIDVCNVLLLLIIKVDVSQNLWSRLLTICAELLMEGLVDAHALEDTCFPKSSLTLLTNLESFALSFMGFLPCDEITVGSEFKF